MKPFLKFGIATGVAISLWLLLSFAVISALGISPLRSRALSGLFSILILVMGVLLGLREAKKKNNDQISYKVAVITGIKISLVTAIIVSLYSLLYCTLINPGFPEVMAAETEKSLTAAGFPPEEIASKLSAVKQEFSAPMQVMQSLVGQAVMGTIASLIIGLFIRTKQ